MAVIVKGCHPKAKGVKHNVPIREKRKGKLKDDTE
jgi:hypothetical protein